MNPVELFVRPVNGDPYLFLLWGDGPPIYSEVRLPDAAVISAEPWSIGMDSFEVDGQDLVIHYRESSVDNFVALKIRDGWTYQSQGPTGWTVSVGVETLDAPLPLPEPSQTVALACCVLVGAAISRWTGGHRA